MSPTPTPTVPADLAAGGRDLTPVALAGALALALAVQLVLPPAPLPAPSLRVSSLRAPGPLASGGRSGAAPATAADPSILARPLFSPARSAQAIEAAAPVGALSLLGVAAEGRRRLATVQDASGAVRTLAVGETVQGWRLGAIHGERAVVTRGGEVQELRVGAGPRPPAPAVANPAASSSGAPPL